VLVLAGSPQIRPAIVDLANLITKHNSLMIVGNVVSPDVSHKTRMYAIKEGHKWLQARKIKAFYDIVQNNEFESGVRALIQTSGIGKLAPNIVLMGYKANWRSSPT
ncbi:Bumetanide-sensitive sodium-(potassium)-chloride cotransporter, partial [Pseudolycoriella hygida]